MQFSQTVGNGPMNKWLNLGGNLITVWIQGLFSGFVTIGKYGKWYQPTALRDAGIVITSPAHDRQPRQTCLGGGMHCPSDTSFQ